MSNTPLLDTERLTITPREDAPNVLVVKPKWKWMMDEQHMRDFGESIESYLAENKKPGEPRKVIMDFSHVKGLSSSFLSMLIAINSRLKGHHDETLAIVSNKEIDSSFEITKLDKLFTMADSVEAAIEKKPGAARQA